MSKPYRFYADFVGGDRRYRDDPPAPSGPCNTEPGGPAWKAKSEPLRAAEPAFAPGSEALIRGSFEVVDVIAQSGDSVLVRRAGGQWTYHADQLEPYAPDVCPIN